MTARHNLTRLCEKYFRDDTASTSWTCSRARPLALKHHVLVTPTLIVLKPKLGVTLLGNLSETSQVLATLRLNGNGR